jgi:MFS superfamily sulfate permease-like transporter
MTTKIIGAPSDGLLGLKQSWKSDATSGFIIFLIAMPLCLAISKASGFPPIAGIYTAIIGGILVSFFMGARVTIKGPAAGLIAIAVGAVEELGKGDNMKGYQLTLAVIVVAAIIQILFGVFKAGKLGDFFPASAVHGMLAAIGIIIISKQLPVLLGAKPIGKEPLELLAEIPYMLANMNPEVAFIGLISLIILFCLPLAGLKAFKIIPPPMIVLLVAVPLASYYDFAHEHDYSLADISYHIVPGNLLVQLPDSFLGGISFPDFSEVFSATSLKYIAMFALVGSLESILSAKAIDILDPFKRKSDLNKDTFAVGVGNLVAGSIGGLPMISEIVRSSANINNGAKTRWSNFFHGVFLLAFVALASDVIRMIPNSALAAMLIYTGYRLASPKEFRKTWNIGWDQLIIFTTTIVVTLATDLLVGIFAGVFSQFVLHLISGAQFKSLFRSSFEISEAGNDYHVKIKDAAIFSNYLSFKKCLDQIKPGKNVTFDFAEAHIVDHTLLEHLHHFEEDYHTLGGKVHMHGMRNHKAHSDHPLATRKIVAQRSDRMEFKLDRRQMELRDLAEQFDFTFYPMTIRSTTKFKDFPIEYGARVLYEENMLSKYTDYGKVEISDIHLTEGAGSAEHNTVMTVFLVSDLHLSIPNFALEPERLWTKIFEHIFGSDIDFNDHPEFSKRYYLRAEDEEAGRGFFRENIIGFLAEQTDMHIEAQRGKLLIYNKRETLSAEEIQVALMFVESFVQELTRTQPQTV